MLMTEREVEVIDEEWLSLMLEARELGLTIEEVRNFLSQKMVNEVFNKGI